METLPRLGDSSIACAARLGPSLVQRSPGCRDGLHVQQYASRLGPLTVLFEHDRSVAFYLRYATPRPHTAELRAAVAQLAAASGGVQRLLIDDAGWFLVAATCSAAGFVRFARAVLPPARQAQLATWEPAQTA
jgi:hypothetical protein